MYDLAHADLLRHELVEAAATIQAATDPEAAWAVYSEARTAYYGADEAAQNDDGVRAGWSQVLATYELTLDRFATPIEPLVRLG